MIKAIQQRAMKTIVLYWMEAFALELSKCHSSRFCWPSSSDVVCFSTLLPSSTHFTGALVKHSLKLLEFLPSCRTLLDILLSLPLAEGVSSSAQCKGVSILLSHFFSLLKSGSAFLMESEYLAVVTAMAGSLWLPGALLHMLKLNDGMEVWVHQHSYLCPFYGMAVPSWLASWHAWLVCSVYMN